jgi:hypothetical protein
VTAQLARSAGGPDGAIPYLLAAATHDTTAMIAEKLVGPKTNEVPEFAPPLRGLNQSVPLAGHVIIADAPGRRRAHPGEKARAQRTRYRHRNP